MIVYKALCHYPNDILWSIWASPPFGLEYKQGEITRAHPDTELLVFDTLEHAAAFIEGLQFSEVWSAETETVHKQEFISSRRFFTIDDLRAWWTSKERRGKVPAPLGTLTTPSLRLLERVD